MPKPATRLKRVLRRLDGDARQKAKDGFPGRGLNENNDDRLAQCANRIRNRGRALQQRRNQKDRLLKPETGTRLKSKIWSLSSDPEKISFLYCSARAASQPIRDGLDEVGYNAGGIEQIATHPAHW